jgi:hypothetical protein
LLTRVCWLPNVSAHSIEYTIALPVLLSACLIAMKPAKMHQWSVAIKKKPCSFLDCSFRQLRTLAPQAVRTAPPQDFGRKNIHRGIPPHRFSWGNRLTPQKGLTPLANPLRFPAEGPKKLLYFARQIQNACLE